MRWNWTSNSSRQADRRSVQAANKRKFAMIYEQRVYSVVPGRMPALLKRFEDHTLRLFDRHGIRQAGFFTTMAGESNLQLTYFLAWESLAEREAKWGAFVTDPKWIEVRNESESDGPIVANVSNQLLAPTSFSSVK